MSNFIVLLLIVQVVLVLLWQLKTLRGTRHSEGEMAPDTTVVDAGISTPNRLYFFYATHSGPCRPMLPLVDRLHQYYPNLIKVDLDVYPDMARGFGIVAIPCFVAVTDGRIREMKIDTGSESWIRTKLVPGI